MDANQISLVPQRWRGVVRIGTLLLTLVWILLFIAGIPARRNELTTVCEGPECPLLTLGISEASELYKAGVSQEAYASYHIMLEIIFVLVSLIPMVIILWRMSHTWVGIIASLSLLSISTNIANVLLALFHYYPIYGVPLAALSRAMLVSITWLIFTFPTGRFVLPWTKWVFVIGMLLQVLFGDKTLRLFTHDFVLLRSAYLIFLGITLLVSFVGLYTQIYRYRYISGAKERQQTKYVIAGFAALWLSVLIWVITIELFPQPQGLPRLIYQVYGVIPIYLLQYILPITLTMSMLRQRLWEIDVFIRRTLVYGSLTAALILVYLGSVVLLQFVFRAVTGQSSQMAIVISTLSIAALFNPLRRRIQNFIDRRFYRRRYDARRALESFALASLTEADLDNLSQRLVEVVQDTVQPEYISLWFVKKETL